MTIERMRAPLSAMAECEPCPPREHSTAGAAASRASCPWSAWMLLMPLPLVMVVVLMVVMMMLLRLMLMMLLRVVEGEC